MSQPATLVAEGMDLHCRSYMHDAGTAVKEAVHAHCNGDHAAARAQVEAAIDALQRAKKFCYPTEPSPAKEIELL